MDTLGLVLPATGIVVRKLFRTPWASHGERNVVFGNEERVAVYRDGSTDVRLEETFADVTDLDYDSDLA